MVLQSNAEAMLVAIPMVGALFAGFFRLDELISRPVRRRIRGKQFSYLDEDGVAVCVEPDGSLNRNSPQREKGGKGAGKVELPESSVL